ncbi:MAG TPA: dockerin type I domain-containing protein, partial [Gammaproteobacteria bacterium]|nr:dockerin type I domain-containing protein [Gammaproteobacteria bacterium]
SIPGLVYYTPSWSSDSAWTLESYATKLQRAGDRFYELETGQPYNPETRAPGSPQFTLVAPDGTRYSIDFGSGTTAVEFADGVRWSVGDSGIVASNGDRVSFITNDEGRIERVVLSDGRQFAYSYDDAGNLRFARDLEEAESRVYGYASDDPHRLILASPGFGSGGSAVVYGAAPATAPLAANLGASLEYLAQTFTGAIGAGGVERLSLSVRPSEVVAGTDDAMYLGVVLEAAAGSSLLPGVPEIVGATAVAGGVQGSRAFALYRITEPGLKLLELGGANASTNGEYRLSFFVAGDVNRDGFVDGTDSQALAAAFGTSTGQPGFNANADFNLDGTVNGTDRELLVQAFGFRANQAPTVVVGGPARTHVDLEVRVAVASLISDLESDQTFYRIVGATNGTARLSGDGESVVFTPDVGYFGPATFTIVADDGFAQSAPATVTVNVSNAALTAIDFVSRSPAIGIGGAIELETIGDFEDQIGVRLPGSYLTWSTTNGAATVSIDGTLRGNGQGTGAVVASRGDLRAVTAYLVGRPDPGDLVLLIRGLDAYPDSVTLAANGGVRQIKLVVTGDDPEEDIGAAADGTLYFSSDERVATVTADGRITAVGPGEAVITVIHKMSEALIPVKIVVPAIGPTTIGSDGGLVASTDGLQLAIAPHALENDVTASIVSLTPAEVTTPLLPSEYGWIFGGAFRLDIGGESLTEPAQLAIPTTLAPGSEV